MSQRKSPESAPIDSAVTLLNVVKPVTHRAPALPLADVATERAAS